MDRKGNQGTECYVRMVLGMAVHFFLDIKHLSVVSFPVQFNVPLTRSVACVARQGEADHWQIVCPPQGDGFRMQPSLRLLSTW